MTRCRSRRQLHRSAYHHRSPHPGRVLLIALIGLLILGGATSVVVFVAIALPVLLLALFGAGLIKVHRAARRARRRRSGYATARTLRAPEEVPTPRAAPDWRAEWRAARRRFATLRGEYAAYECDPLAVLELPALADVTVPATERFVDAFAEAQALDTDELPPAEHAASFRRAVDRACRSWQAARDAAERIRLAGLSPEERASVRRVIKLLTVAKDSGNDAERLAAYAKARAELAKLERAGHIHLPRQAVASLEASARAGLPTGFQTSPVPEPARRPSSEPA
jgi:hypothetical protein